MKWSVVGLMLLGLAAAACATVLVTVLRADASREVSVVTAKGTEVTPAIPEIDILLANSKMPAMTVIEASSVATKSVPRDQAPAGSFSDLTQVLGHVLAVPVVEGQVFTPACFVSEGTGKHLAATLPDGMRAVSVLLSTDSGLDGILYPGSIVDVLVSSLKVSSPQGGKNEVVATILLEGIPVLAVEDRTVVSSDDDAQSRRRDIGRRRMVTLMVNVKQAEMLRLATEHGTVSLALRNPTDAAPVYGDGVLLKELFAQLERLEVAAEEPASEEVAAPPVEPEKTKPLSWEVIVIRGDKKDTRSVPLSE